MNVIVSYSLPYCQILIMTKETVYAKKTPHRTGMRIFEGLMCFYAKNYDVTIHNYCLISNHYHILIEIQSENLSKFMRQLNMNYSIFFNKKNKRVGHLWQGRFKSWFVTDDAYLYTLMCYIEQNPRKANMVRG